MRVDQWCSGVSDLSGLRTLVAPTKIDTVAGGTYGDCHEDGQPSADRSVHRVWH